MSNLVIISVKVLEKHLRAIDKLVEEGLFVSRSDFIRAAIKYYLSALAERIDIIKDEVVL